MEPEQYTHPRRLEAWALVGGGLVSALGLVLFATGRHKEAYALGVAGALTGSAIGAIRLLGRRS